MDKAKWIKKYIIIIVLLSVFVRFFAGTYVDSEFNEKYLFVKNKPAWKWHFYSPRGDSDRSLDSMTQNEKEEQLMYDKYVPNRLWEFPITIHM